ncbi:MAG: beta-galactosidase [Myxococcota bacterium]|jgi:beta-galactosidase
MTPLLPCLRRQAFRAIALSGLLVSLTSPSLAAEPVLAKSLQPNVVTVHKDDAGFKLQVDGKDFMVLGMNWGYIPVGENYRYDLWSKSDDFIKVALAQEMGLLKAMGANTIRQFPGVPPRWITYMYETYGIHTVMNHTTGRYGFLVDGTYVSPVDYSEPRFREVVRADIQTMVNTYKDTPGIIMWMLGNENNYGLSWKSYEIESLPEGERNAAKAEHLYSFWGEIVRDIKGIDTSKPVAIANGDLQYVDLIAKHVLPAGLDIMGSNVYRGPSSRDLFQVVQDKLNLPFMYTEFGADAYNAREDREDQVNQAHMSKAVWQEVFEMSHGKGRVGNAIGGLHFQWSDGWWKYLQDTNLDVQDPTASWSNEAYQSDFMPGQNNMNEEWYGICAKGPRDASGHFPLYPRATYYVLQKAWAQDPYSPATTLSAVRTHWDAIRVADNTAKYAAEKLRADFNLFERFKLKEVRLEFEMFNTGGSLLGEPEREGSRFDTLQSFYVDIGLQPTKRLSGNLRLNILGNVPNNPIDEIFYENSGLSRTLTDAAGEEVVLNDIERLKVHGAGFKWDEPWFTLEGYYRQGHYHWGYEGDFFGLYPEANYGDAIDIYNAAAPFGFLWTGKKDLDGLKLAFGPEIYWGANPTIMGKYSRTFGDYAVTLIHQEDIARQGETVAASNAVPEQKTRRTTVHVATQLGPFKVELGGISSGSPKVGDRFLIPEDTSGPGYLGTNTLIQEDTVAFADTLGAKAKVTYESGIARWYLQGAYKGVVADGGPDSTITFTGWRLKENGRGNHWNILGGAAFNVGYWQIAPNFLYQRPLVGPLPLIDEQFNVGNGVYFPGIAGRNILKDPFVVRGNREQFAAELMVTFDPTPGTWLWSWDNEKVEDAKVAVSMGFVYRHLPTIQDGGIGRLSNGTAFGFATSAPAHDLWEANVRGTFNPDFDFKIIWDLYAGTGQANGDDTRLVERFGTRMRLKWHRLAADLAFKYNDWGPYDYHRDFNFTFPLQLLADVSYGLILPRWLGENYTRFGVRAGYRTLDEFSNRFRPDPRDTAAHGEEWEIRSYVHVSL